MRLIGLAVALVFLIMPLAAEAQSGGRVEAYRIGPEDVLLISVWKNEAMTRAVPVRPDGKISLPLLNDVQAAGLTAREFRDVVTERLTEFMPNPEVSVIVTEVRSLNVSVIGAERSAVLDLDTPGCVKLRTGFRQSEKGSKIIIVHTDGRAVKKIPFNYNKVATENWQDFCLRQGDIVIVP